MVGHLVLSIDAGFFLRDGSLFLAIVHSQKMVLCLDGWAGSSGIMAYNWYIQKHITKHIRVSIILTLDRKSIFGSIL